MLEIFIFIVIRFIHEPLAWMIGATPSHVLTLINWLIDWLISENRIYFIYFYRNAHRVSVLIYLSLFVIAVERFIAVAFPFRYRSLFTRAWAKACVALTWTVGTFITGVFHGLKIVYIQNVILIFLVLLTFSIYVYIFSVALKHEKKIAAMRSQVPNFQRSSPLPWERKSAQTMGIVLGVYILCWVPSVVFYSVVRTDDWLFPRLQFWINSVYYLNAVLNPFIYGVRSGRFRKEVRRLIKSFRARRLFPYNTS